MDHRAHDRRPGHQARSFKPHCASSICLRGKVPSSDESEQVAAHGLAYREFLVPGTTLWQLFVYDPSGVQLGQPLVVERWSLLQRRGVDTGLVDTPAGLLEHA